MQVSALIPHAGSMCLLDSVLAWDATYLEASANSHVSAENPLRDRYGLPAIAGVEYAAQAMAAHGALVAAGRGSSPRIGMLVTLRGVRVACSTLDVYPGPLAVRVERLTGAQHAAAYEFWIHAGASELLTGRMTVSLGS